MTNENLNGRHFPVAKSTIAVSVQKTDLLRQQIEVRGLVAVNTILVSSGYPDTDRFALSDFSRPGIEAAGGTVLSDSEWITLQMLHEVFIIGILSDQSCKLDKSDRERLAKVTLFACNLRDELNLLTTPLKRLVRHEFPNARELSYLDKLSAQLSELASASAKVRSSAPRKRKGQRDEAKSEFVILAKCIHHRSSRRRTSSSPNFEGFLTALLAQSPALRAKLVSAQAALQQLKRNRQKLESHWILDFLRSDPWAW